MPACRQTPRRPWGFCTPPPPLPRCGIPSVPSLCSLERLNPSHIFSICKRYNSCSQRRLEEDELTKTPGVAHSPLVFGVSEFTTWRWDFQQDVDHYPKLGVQAIEVCEFKLDPHRIREQLALIHERGLRISSAQPSVRTLFPSKSQPEPKEVRDRVSRFRRTIESFGDSARDVPFVANTGIPPGGNIQMVIEVAVQEYRLLADFAAERGAKVALEPLNASIMNLESAIWTLGQANRLVDAVDRENFGICLDFWNIWQNADIEREIKKTGDRIMVVQVSDWRIPRSDQDRLIPGQGEVPIANLMFAARKAGFSGAYSVEIFSGGVPGSLWDRNPAEVVTESRQGMEAAWGE